MEEGGQGVSPCTLNAPGRNISDLHAENTKSLLPVSFT